MPVGDRLLQHLGQVHNSVSRLHVSTEADTHSSWGCTHAGSQVLDSQQFVSLRHFQTTAGIFVYRSQAPRS